MADLRADRVVHLFLGEHDITPGPEPRLMPQLLRTVTTAAAEPGDVLVVELSEAVTLAGLQDALAAADVVVPRGPSIWDVYRSTFGDDVLRACGQLADAHHTQARKLVLGPDDVVQVAVYPTPASAGGVRLWCDPAVVFLFVSPGATARVLEVLRPIRPLWERLRAHHGRPLLHDLHTRLSSAYPVVDAQAPLAAPRWTALCEAVGFLLEERSVDDVVSSRTSPQRAVEQTLLHRREVHDHARRLVRMLEHSHGTVGSKYESLEVLSTQRIADPESAMHFTAPHRHLVAGLKETQRDVEDLVARASDTASLVASSAVGRLLDRSEATRTAGAVVAMTLVVISVITTFTSIASLPDGERRLPVLARLGGWVGAAGIALTAIVVGVSRLAGMPPMGSEPLRRRLRVAVTVGVLAATGLLVAGGILADVLLVGLGLFVVLAAGVVHAAIHDFT